MYHICDLHSHFLPDMDDGCKTVSESVAVLELAQSQGVTKLIATPHYYHKQETADQFIMRRNASEQQLRQALAQIDAPMPQFCCGAEVAYFAGIDQYEELELLCMGKSRYLLIELPFSPWSGQVLRDLQNITLRGFNPVLAHIERYISLQSPKSMEKLLELDLLVQMNGESLLGFWRGASARRILARGTAHLLGSDCHGIERRPFKLGQAIAYLEKKKMTTSIASVERLSNEIFEQALG